MIDKTTRDGELLVYTVDRKTGEPRPGAQVEIVREKKTIATGVTDNQGILRTRIEKPKKPAGNRRRGRSETMPRQTMPEARKLIPSRC